MLSKSSKIFVAGHNGMVGSAICRQLLARGYQNLVTESSGKLDLREQQAVEQFMRANKPDYVVLAAARVGGIKANNDFPAEFIYENMMIQSNVIHQAFRAGVRGLLFLGSSCIYPKFAEQPIQESALLTGELESTNEPYAIAKIAGIKLCESYNRQYSVDYRSVMPTNLYGPNDNFHPENSHVIPGLLRRIHEAREADKNTVEIWGTGQVRREFLHVDDMASASVFLMELPQKKYLSETTPMLSHLNVGSGSDVTIAELAAMICEVVGYQGRLVFDHSKPDGTPRKLMDNSKLRALGWSPKIDLRDGLAQAYQWFIDNGSSFRQ